MSHAHLHSNDEVLKGHGIRPTLPRGRVLEIFSERSFALSQPDIEKMLAAEIDRVTIYRTLSLFLEKGILHKVLDDTGAMKYALCPGVCSTHSHQHNHVHFKCERCGHTLCLDEIGIPEFRLPAGYVLEESNLLMRGICPNCNKTK